MTDRRRRPRAAVVMTTAVATFLVVLALLAVQLHAGRDPALGNGRQAVALAPGGHSSKIVTRTSGGATAARPNAGTASRGHHAVVTRASGGGEHGDE